MVEAEFQTASPKPLDLAPARFASMHLHSGDSDMQKVLPRVPCSLRGYGEAGKTAGLVARVELNFWFKSISSSLESCAEPAVSGVCLSFPQVTIEVVQDPQTEVEMNLPSEPSNLWPLHAPSWLPTRELFWPLFWGYQEGEEEATSLKDRALGEAGEEAGKDYAVEYGEGEDQGGSEEDEDEEPWSSGAIDSWNYGWLDRDIQEPDSYGEWSGLLSPAAALRGLEWERVGGEEESLPGREHWAGQQPRPVQVPLKAPK